MSVGIKKIPGVESVEVSLNQGLATVLLKEGNTVRLEQLQDVVKRSGFTPKDAKVSARGEVIFSGGKLTFKLLGVDRMYDVHIGSGAETTSGDVEKQKGKVLIIEGVIPAPESSKATVPPVIQLHAFR